MSELTFEQLEVLAKAVAGMKGFIDNPCGEDRDYLRVDLARWEALWACGSKLHEAILKKHKQLNPAQN